MDRFGNAQNEVARHRILREIEGAMRAGAVPPHPKETLQGNPMASAHPEPPGADPRIDGQYLQAAMQFWTNINTIIWQRLAAILAVQSGGLSLAFAQRHSWISVMVLALALGVSVGLLYLIVSDQKVRTKLTLQANYISGRLLGPLLEGRKDVPHGLKVPFELYDLETDKGEPLTRHHSGAWMLGLVLTVLDVGTAIAFNFVK